MAFDPNKPANDGYLADAPQELRTNFTGLKNDQIVNAGSLRGLVPGNASGNIPINNGTLNTNLNAEKLGGQPASFFAPATHTHTTATSSSNGFMSNTDKAKLDTIATGAEVNQNAFSNILVGGTTIQADSKTDTLEIMPGANIAVTPDATNDRITIAVTGKVPSAANADYSNYATAAGDANTVDGKHASDFVSQFSISKNDNTVNYVKIAELTTDIGSSENGLVLYVNGIADFGDNTPGMDIVQVSTRDSVSLKVYKVIPSIREKIQYGYVNNATTRKTEIWIKRDAYNYGVNIIVAQSRDATVGILTTQSTEPSGITYVPREYFIYASDVVTTPTANKILKLNSNAKLPASITGDAATVGGKTPGTGANNVLVLDASGKVPPANLPIASGSTLGAIKVGANLSIDGNGVLSALSTAFDAGKSFAANGYQKLSNGLIIQWGIENSTSSGSKTVTFPIAFTSGAYGVVAGNINGSTLSNGAILIKSHTSTGFTLHKWDAVPIFYIAIGV